MIIVTHMPALESVDISCLRFTQSIRLLIPVLVPLPVARYNMLGVTRVTCYPALELQALPLTSEQRFVT